jgi:DNA-binding response OmpR family regulator
VLCVAYDPARLQDIVRTVNEVDGCVHLSATSADHALAICVSQHVDIAILAEGLLSVDGWSVAQSLKMVRPSLTTIVLAAGKHEAKCVDVSVRNLDQLRAAIQRVSGEQKSATA